MAQVQTEEKPYDDINITPMLDLAYVLLIMFIILTTAAVQGMKVDLPRASASATQNLAVPRTKVISVSEQGQVFLDAVPVTLPELERRLRDLKATQTDLPVVLRGDRAVQYEKIMAVLDIAARVGITQIGLAAQRVVSS
jgi:biopolymer transport protein ExbD